MAREKEHRATVFKTSKHHWLASPMLTFPQLGWLRECKKLLGMLANARHSCINAAKIKKASVKIKA